MDISLSPLDLERFGVTTAKAALSAGDRAPDAAAWCRSKAVQMLIARVPTSAVALVQQLEQQGAFLTDTLLYYSRKQLSPEAAALPDGYRWRLATPADADAVAALAALTFTGYAGHYHADHRLDQAAADAVYADWAANSCRNPKVADAVLLIEHDGALIAFATLKDRGEALLEGVLFGVHPDHQGRRLYQALMQQAQHWGSQHSFSAMTVSTQVVNLAVQKVWCRLGFEPSSSYYTFHQWFGESA
ncbi:GNAT family N-acetyltransferase [Duganella sp. sic0402]|uniref:GNAT family N-acetyltransferase n=1 Tax=Duganella sp. sic0402 TaxID=2854786 RepID=UPI001C453251|nr:GNAT family N-acetyltransferase [Duganella sp. sic0402]MBV7537488.1 GNAT family N-acetyltransferase [Duganella sp. sic0402]